VTGEYSTDGTTWTAVGRPAPLPANARSGLFAFSNDGTGNPVAPSTRSRSRPGGVGGGGPSGPSRDDEFDGSSLDKSRWNAIVREDAAAYAVSGGQLTITTQPGDIYTGDSNPPPNNFILQKAPTRVADWTIETKMSGTINGGYGQGGLIAYKDGQLREVRSDLGRGQHADQPHRAPLRGGRAPSRPAAQRRRARGTTDIWLRLTKAGTSYSGAVLLRRRVTWVADAGRGAERHGRRRTSACTRSAPRPRRGRHGLVRLLLARRQDAPWVAASAWPARATTSTARSLDKTRWNAIVREQDEPVRIADGWLTSRHAR
jgi:hypothetical protein